MVRKAITEHVSAPRPRDVRRKRLLLEGLQHVSRYKSLEILATSCVYKNHMPWWHKKDTVNPALTYNSFYNKKTLTCSKYMLDDRTIHQPSEIVNVVQRPTREHTEAYNATSWRLLASDSCHQILRKTCGPRTQKHVPRKKRCPRAMLSVASVWL